jgi:hypothetical protein
MVVTVGDLDSALERTVAAGTARLALFRAREAPVDWWEAGHGVTDLAARRTHVRFRPIPPDWPRASVCRQKHQVEYLYDGGCRWVKQPGDPDWSVPLGRPYAPRSVSDPTWDFDAMWGAEVVGRTA